VPDVSSIAPADVRLWVSLDVHKFSIVAATLAPSGGKRRALTSRLRAVTTRARAVERPLDLRRRGFVTVGLKQEELNLHVGADVVVGDERQHSAA
jgi:hypothetical protein